MIELQVIRIARDNKTERDGERWRESSKDLKEIEEDSKREARLSQSIPRGREYSSTRQKTYEPHGKVFKNPVTVLPFLVGELTLPQQLDRVLETLKRDPG